MGKVVDLTGVKTEFPVVDKGDYVATVTKGEYREAGSKGAEKSKADMEHVEFTIKHAAEDEDDIEFQGSKVFKNYNLGKDSLWSWKQLAKCAGVDPDTLEGPLDPEIVTAEDIVGCDVIITVDTREWENQTLNDVKKVKELEEF